jgi:hypothetical protein
VHFLNGDMAKAERLRDEWILPTFATLRGG